MLTAPQSDEVEVALFGPGFGEAIAVHLQNGDWILVDSCITPAGDPAALHYLKGIGVNPATQVKAIIATHWHNDHVKGLSRVVAECPAAKFVCSSALWSENFLAFVDQLGSEYDKRAVTAEFDGVIKLIARRDNAKSVRWAAPDRLILCDRGAVPYEVCTLSPSDAASSAAFAAVGKLFANTPSLPVQPDPDDYKPNHASVVLHVRVGAVAFLLGADLEQDGNPYGGWKVIVDSQQRPQTKCSLFKVPHHGSQNGHHPEVWTDLLEKNPLAVLTPYAQGRKPLPSPDDVKRLVGLSHAFVSAEPKFATSRRRSGVVNQTIHELVNYIHNVPTGYGFIRSRRTQSETEWRVELAGGAVELSAEMLSV